jgi:hypothetical protein
MMTPTMMTAAVGEVRSDICASFLVTVVAVARRACACGCVILAPVGDVDHVGRIGDGPDSADINKLDVAGLGWAAASSPVSPDRATKVSARSISGLHWRFLQDRRRGLCWRSLGPLNRASRQQARFLCPLVNALQGAFEAGLAI